MTLYALVHNNQIQVGPRSWNRGFFLDYLQEEDLDFSLLPRSQQTEAVITDDWRLLPVTDVDFPNLDGIYEQLVGPFWTIHEDHISGLYTKTDSELNGVKGVLKNTVASNRYSVEVGKLEYTFSDGQKVELYTAREERMIYLNTLQTLPDGMTVSFKFKNGIFRTGVTKTELQEIVSLGMMHIADSFEWEASKVSEIEAASTKEELKAIELKHPSQSSSEMNDLMQGNGEL
jgi:hypothetical protein